MFPNLTFMFHYIPNWVIASAILAATALVALGAAQLLRRMAARFLRFNHPLIHAVLARAGNLFLFAAVLLATALIAPSLPLPEHTVETINRILIALFVILAGWIAIVASDLAADRYMGRFRIDVEDNLLARRAVTQMRVLKRIMNVLLGTLTLAFALMTFDSVRQFGVSIFASAGIAGIAVGLAAKPVLSNLIAGVQLAITQPIRIDDVVIVNGEYGCVEEFGSTYVVLRLWDWRRMIVPLSYFLENSFENWTRTSSSLIGSVYFHLDHRTPIPALRAKVEELAKESQLWDGRVVNLQVSDSTEKTVEIRVLVSARDSAKAWDLRCEIREKMLAWLQAEYPESLPRRRNEAVSDVRTQMPRASEMPQFLVERGEKRTEARG
ncbi:MAG TPA: mechanosensitive ion channel domain-containing protein [Rhizomicrobium sp.]|nr:mechanosensitive ion channel domain-containing protein [Rhizomicrobium sp.]